MKLVVFGASGKTGRQVVAQACAAGHDVVAAVRNPDACTDFDAQVICVQCDVSADVDMEVFAIHPDADAVVIALGAKELWGNTVRSDGTRNIVAAINAANLSPRLFVVSAAGVNESWAQLGLVAKLFAKLLLPAVMTEHQEQETIVTESGLPYCLLRPSGLTEADTAAYQIIETGKLPNSQISRKALAHCVLDQLENGDGSNGALTVTGA